MRTASNSSRTNNAAAGFFFFQAKHIHCILFGIICWNFSNKENCKPDNHLNGNKSSETFKWIYLPDEKKRIICSHGKNGSNPEQKQQLLLLRK